MALLTKGANNPKTAKGAELGFVNAILHLAPSDLSGQNVCPFASAGCRAACLNTAGRGQMTVVQDARIAKTQKYLADRDAFVSELAHEILALNKKAARYGKTAAVRLNGTSDIMWATIPVEWRGIVYPNLMTAFPDVQFYDYTKIPVANHFRSVGGREFWPVNYDLTFSLSENNDKHAVAALAAGFRVAAVLDSLPDVWGGYPVVNGDEHDFRFLDPAGVIVGLKAKGKAKKDTTGFVRSGEGGFVTSNKVTVALQRVAA